MKKSTKSNILKILFNRKLEKPIFNEINDNFQRNFLNINKNPKSSDINSHILVKYFDFLFNLFKFV